MNQDDQIDSALECGMAVSRSGNGYWDNIDQLSAYTAAVEAPLQARIARLENSLQLILDEVKYQAERGGWEDRFEIDVAKATLQDSDATWLSEHDKEVEAPLQARMQSQAEEYERMREFNDGVVTELQARIDGLLLSNSLLSASAKGETQEVIKLQARIAQLEAAIIELLSHHTIDFGDREKARQTLVESPSTWLSAHDKEVEAPLQARIAQLEEALQVANKYMPVYGRSEEFNTHIDIVNDAKKTSATWLSEHDKEVAAIKAIDASLNRMENKK